MKRSTCLRFLPVLLVPTCLLAGCSAEPVPLAPVKGKVTYRGAPLTSGMIVFAPDENRGSQGPLAQAEIQGDGSYVLKTGEELGVKPGFYRVTVAAVEVLPPGQGFSRPRSLLPDRYRDPRLSGLVCEVKPNRDNGINFNLE